MQEQHSGVRMNGQGRERWPITLAANFKLTSSQRRNLAVEHFLVPGFEVLVIFMLVEHPVTVTTCR